MPRHKPRSTSGVDETGLVDLVVMLAATLVVFWITLPFIISMVNEIGLKQQLDQTAWNLARSATLTGILPPKSISIDGQTVSVSTSGGLAGCAYLQVRVATWEHVSSPLGLSLVSSSLRVGGSAIVQNSAYQRPDQAGFNCENG